MRNLDVSTLAGRGNLAGARIILIVGVDLHIPAEEGNLCGKGGAIEVAFGLLHGGGGDDAPFDYELGRAGDRSRRHVLDGRCLRILEAEGVGCDGDLRAGTPTTLDGLGGNDEAFDAAVKELEVDVIVIEIILGVLPTTFRRERGRYEHVCVRYQIRIKRQKSQAMGNMANKATYESYFLLMRKSQRYQSASVNFLLPSVLSRMTTSLEHCGGDDEQKELWGQRREREAY